MDMSWGPGRCHLNPSNDTRGRVTPFSLVFSFVEIGTFEYEWTRKHVEGMLRVQGASLEDAQDFVQEAFARVAGTPEPVQNLGAFVYTVARNLGLDQVRRRRTRERYRITVEALYGEHWDTRDPCRILCAAESLAALSDCVKALPVRRRHTWWSVRVLGERFTRVSEKYRVSLKATEKHLRKADQDVAAAPDYRDWHCETAWASPATPDVSGDSGEGDDDSDTI